jgi:hypothetical protein
MKENEKDLGFSINNRVKPKKIMESMFKKLAAHYQKLENKEKAAQGLKGTKLYQADVLARIIVEANKAVFGG